MSHFIIKPLPIPDNYDINDFGEIHYFTLTQGKTDDVFTASIKHRCNGFELLIGGDELNGCIMIDVKEIDYPSPDSLIEAFLNVKYSETQNITNDLSKGMRTIALMQTAISFVFTYFKFDDFILKDLSKFICSPRQQISLPALYILKYGQSWFQKHFNANFYNKTLSKNIAKYKKFVSTKQEWNYLYHTYILPEFRVYKMYSNKQCDDKETLQKIQHIKTVLYNAWSRTSCYRDFILDVISDDTQCCYLMGWFNDIFNDIVNTGFYEDVDNIILGDEFPYIEDLNVSYLKTTYMRNKTENKGEDELSAIKTLCQNEEYTTDKEREKENDNDNDNVIFTKILSRRPNVDENMKKINKTGFQARIVF